jgi:hypothetical protein
MPRRKKMAVKGSLDGYMPGDDPLQAEHDAMLVSLTDEQHKAFAEGLKAYMDRLEADEAACTAQARRQTQMSSNPIGQVSREPDPLQDQHDADLDAMLATYEARKATIAKMAQATTGPSNATNETRRLTTEEIVRKLEGEE